MVPVMLFLFNRLIRLAQHIPREVALESSAAKDCYIVDTAALVLEGNENRAKV